MGSEDQSGQTDHQQHKDHPSRRLLEANGVREFRRVAMEYLIAGGEADAERRMGVVLRAANQVESEDSKAVGNLRYDVSRLRDNLQALHDGHRRMRGLTFGGVVRRALRSAGRKRYY